MAGSAADGVLGVATHDGVVTIVTGWNWYADADSSAIAAGQHDLQTIATHELGHVMGLEHSPDGNSVMYRSLADAVARRTLTAHDLSGLGADDDTEPHALRAAGFDLVSESEPMLPPAYPIAIGAPAHDGRFGIGQQAGGQRLPAAPARFAAYGAHVAALDLVMAEWSSSNDYDTRVDNMCNATGSHLGGTGIHLDADSPDRTIFDDGDKDRDWFLATLGGSNKDKVKDDKSDKDVLELNDLPQTDVVCVASRNSTEL